MSRRLLNELLSEFENCSSGSGRVNDQILFNELIDKDPTWVSHIYPLPEALFLIGLGYKILLPTAPSAALMHGALRPCTFHANWTIGLKNKRALMIQTGTWLLN